MPDLYFIFFCLIFVCYNFFCPQKMVVKVENLEGQRKKKEVSRRKKSNTSTVINFCVYFTFIFTEEIGKTDGLRRKQKVTVQRQKDRSYDRNTLYSPNKRKLIKKELKLKQQNGKTMMWIKIPTYYAFSKLS